jgi:hypothetical protein
MPPEYVMPGSKLLNEKAGATAGNGAAAAPQPIRSYYWTLDDIAALEPPEWIIGEMLPRRVKALIFGESGHYKTMHAVDALCRQAHGMDYHGLVVTGSYPVCFIANEDAYGLAVQRVQGWHLHYGRPNGRVIIMPGNTKLDHPEDVERAIACARDAFGEERPIFAIDTWDRSISGNPNSTEDINPALSGLDALLAVGELTLTISHSPWNDKNRTKGAVTFWANHDTRIKAEKDEETGRGTLEVVHHKNARSGLIIEFTFEQFDFEHRNMQTNTLIPQRNYDYKPERKVKKTKSTTAKPWRGSNQRIFCQQLGKLFARHPNGVDRSLLRSHFILEMNSERQRDGQQPLDDKESAKVFRNTLAGLRDRDPPPFTEDGDLFLPQSPTGAARP